MKYESLPQEIKQLRQWVNVLNKSKVPMCPYNNRMASSTNPETWSDFNTAVNAVQSGRYDGIGFVFRDNGIVGIDIDAGFDTDGFLTELSLDCMNACKSYTEKSRSGRGIHILVKGKLPFNGRNNRSGVEIYQTGRYFICTGENLIFRELFENQTGINYIVNKYFPETIKESETTAFNPAIYTPIFDEPKGGKINLQPSYPKIGIGERNISLTSVAGSMHTVGYNKQQILEELRFINKTACYEPLPDYELRVIANSVTRYKRS